MRYVWMRTNQWHRRSDIEGAESKALTTEFGKELVHGGSCSGDK